MSRGSFAAPCSRYDTNPVVLVFRRYTDVLAWKYSVE
jgi:hypothetical protein